MTPTVTQELDSARPEPAVTAPASAVTPAEDSEVLADLVVEEISIDGMCGVY